MCFAPRYRNGPTAAPSIPSRKRASLPVTPCASAIDGRSPVSKVDRTSATGKNRVFTVVSLLRLVLDVARIARLVDRLARGEERLDVPALSRFERDRRRVHHGARADDPLVFVF